MLNQVQSVSQVLWGLGDQNSWLPDYGLHEFNGLNANIKYVIRPPSTMKQNALIIFFICGAASAFRPSHIPNITNAVEKHTNQTAVSQLSVMCPPPPYSLNLYHCQPAAILRSPTTHVCRIAAVPSSAVRIHEINSLVLFILSIS